MLEFQLNMARFFQINLAERTGAPSSYASGVGQDGGRLRRRRAEPAVMLATNLPKRDDGPVAAVRPDKGDLAKWGDVMESLVGGAVDPMPVKCDHATRRTLQRVRADPLSQAVWRKLQSAAVAMHQSTGQIAWDEVAGAARDGLRMAKRLAEIRRAHVPHCDENGPMTRAGDNWHCTEGASCTARHWGFDGAELDDPDAR